MNEKPDSGSPTDRRSVEGQEHMQEDHTRVEPLIGRDGQELPQSGNEPMPIPAERTEWIGDDHLSVRPHRKTLAEQWAEEDEERAGEE